MSNMAAIQADAEGRAEPYFDEELEPLKELLSALSYDTFKKLALTQMECTPGEEILLPIDDTFACVVRPDPVAAPEGAPPVPGGGGLTLNAMVVDRSDPDAPVIALAAAAEMPLGQTILFRDIPRESGKLLVFLTPSMGQSQQQQQQEQDRNDEQQQSEQQQDQEDQQEDTEQQEQSPPQPDKENPEEQQAAQEESPAEEQDKEPKDMQNVQAVLEALEELDKREQKLMRDAPALDTLREWW
ncbi:MAG TPA: hypothetical protein PKI11_18205 [Candidatus Hydrogenedentes bacterium]|nr:hypothetical protein [Candidatus Hydrogenedentota bacterium]